jgi:hypothetical protein
MRDLPALVDRVAAEAARQLVEQAALGHARERQRRHVQRLQVGHGCVRARVPVAQQPRDRRRMRKSRRAAESAPLRIEAAFVVGARGLERCVIEHRGSGRRRIQVGQRCGERRGRRTQLCHVRVVVRRHAAQHVAEGG